MTAAYGPDTELPFDTQTPIRIGSLFSGYGGLDMAVEAVTGGKTAWVSDIDPGACKILAHRYADVPNLGDITAIDWSAVTPIEVLCAGFPCQDVSGSGKRAGLRRGTRSGLWHEVVRAIAALRPQLVVLENVRGLLSARGDEPTAAHLAAEASRDAYTSLIAWIDDRRYRAVQEGRVDDARRLTNRRARALGLRERAVGRVRRHERRLVRALGTVLGSLADLGYDAVWYCLRAADVGAPHGRFRIFILAWPAHSASLPRCIFDGDRQPAADAERGRLDGRAPDPLGQEIGRAAAARSGQVALLPSPRTSDTNGAGQHGDGGLDLRTAVSLLPTPRATPWAKTSDAARAKYTSGDSMQDVVDKRSWGKYDAAIAQWVDLTRPAPPPAEISDKGSARLSPRFSEWLMGLPDGWVTEVPGVTRNEALKACGNGVVPQQAEAALRLLLPVVWELAA